MGHGRTDILEVSSLGIHKLRYAPDLTGSEREVRTHRKAQSLIMLTHLALLPSQETHSS